MDLHGKKVTLHDMSLRDGMHAKRHQISIDEMVAVARGLDQAGMPLIEVTHGDGLGGASVNYGFSPTARGVSRRCGTKDEAGADFGATRPGNRHAGSHPMAADMGASTIRIATHCTRPISPSSTLVWGAISAWTPWAF